MGTIKSFAQDKLGYAMLTVMVLCCQKWISKSNSSDQSTLLENPKLELEHPQQNS